MALKNTLLKKYKALYKLRQKAWAIEKEIRAEHINHLHETKVLFAGDRVEVWAVNGGKLGEGIVGGANMIIEESMIKQLIDNPKKIQEHLDNILYEVFAIRKDDTVSAKHFFERPHCMTLTPDRMDDYYIKKIEI